jgi:hypothetical protein
MFLGYRIVRSEEGIEKNQPLSEQRFYCLEAGEAVSKTESGSQSAAGAV